MCNCTLPNKAFSPRGKRRHLCRACAAQPAALRERAQRLRRLEEMLFRQSNISAKNIALALTWAKVDDPEVRALAEIVAEVGRVHPGKRKRFVRIRHNQQDLWAKMVAAGLVMEYHQPDDAFAGADVLMGFDAGEVDDERSWEHYAFIDDDFADWSGDADEDDLPF